MDATSPSKVTDIFAALAPSGLGISHVSVDGKFLDVNPSLCKILGYSREELIGRHFSEITHPDDVSDNVEGVQGLISERPPSYRVEKRYLRKDNSVVWVTLLALLIEGTDGAADSLLVFAEDVTDRKRLEAEKQAIEIRYETLFSQLPDSIILTDVDTRVIGFNDEALRTYEYSPEEMLRLRVADFSLAYNEEQVQEIGRRLVETGRQDFLSQHRTKSGRILDIKVSLRVINMPDGEIIFQCVYRDITAIKEIERALTQEKTNLNAILDNIPHLLWLKDVQGRFIANNAAHLVSVGLASQEEIIGKTDFDIWPKELAEKFRADDAEVMATRKRKHLEEYVLHQGNYVWVETYKTPILGEDGSLLGTVGFARDITEHKRTEEALRKSEERLRQATRASQTGIFDHDHPTNTLYWSPEMRAIYGVGPDEPASFEAFIGGIHPEDRERIVANIQRAHDPAVSKGTFKFEFRYIRKDGVIRWLSVRAQAFFVGEGTARHVVRTIGAVLDITERKRIEESLRTSEERFRTLADAAPLCIFLTTSAGECIYTNPRWTEISGQSYEESLGYGWMRAIYPDPPV